MTPPKEVDRISPILGPISSLLASARLLCNIKMSTLFAGTYSLLTLIFNQVSALGKIHLSSLTLETSQFDKDIE